MQKQENILENESHKILGNFEIQTDHQPKDQTYWCLFKKKSKQKSRPAK